MTDGRTDGRTEGRKAKNYVPLLFFEKAGDNKYTHRIVLYVLVYDQDKDNLKDFRNEMSFRVTFVSVGQLYKPLTEITSTVSIPIEFKWEHRKSFADHSGRRFCKLLTS